MQMPARNYTASNSSYRYGFNGKELDKETSSTTTYDYGFRIYSPALGRFLSVDPLYKDYPWYSPYQFAGNKPIAAADLDGLEEWMRTQEILLRQEVQLQQQAAASQQKKAAQQALQAMAQQPVFRQADNSVYAQQRSEYFQRQYQMTNAINGATMDPLAASMYAPVPMAAAKYVNGTIEHVYGIYEGIRDKDYWSAAKNTGLFALDVAPFIPFKGAGVAGNAAVRSADEIFSSSIATRGFAEDFAVTTKSYKGWKNMNDIVPNNPGFDLYDNLGNVADITTTSAQKLNASQFYKKLDNLANLKGFNQRTLQIYVKEGQYTAEQLGGLQQKLNTFISDFKLKNTDAKITQIK